MRGRGPDHIDESLPTESLRALQVSFTFSFGLLFLFLFFPVTVATLIGTPAILLFAAASWVLFGSIVLTYWPFANSYPALTLPILLLGVAMSYWNDNHIIRSIRDTEIKTEAVLREEPRVHFRKWLSDKLNRAPVDCPYPVFVVAAAGGGIRAAYWTASVLGRIADESGGTWPDHLYAMSGVSGGTVGSAIHAVQVAEFLSSQQGRSASYVTQAQQSLRNDILSPVIAYLLFPDLVQRFLPHGFPVTDRARAIELAMESAVADPHGVNSVRFARRFTELWSKDHYRVPALLLNTTIIETGQRGIVSNLKIKDRDFPDSEDLLADGLRTQDMPLSTAAHLSARFTYVSPAGTILTKAGNVWGHAVQGGYFENSGTVTAVELLKVLREAIVEMNKMKSLRASVPLNLIIIRNDPEASSLCEPATSGPKQQIDAYTSLNEILSPVRALLSTRVARGRLAEKTALDLVRDFHNGTIQSTNCKDGCIFEFSLGGCDSDPPLGWSLSEYSCDLMDKHLVPQESKFACIRGLLKGEGCAQEPACEQ